jgi:hypothetical protein
MTYGGNCELTHSYEPTCYYSLLNMEAITLLESMLQQIAKMISKTLYHGPDNQILLSYRPETY